MKTILPIQRPHIMCAVLFVFCMFAALKSDAVCTASFNAVPDTSGNGVTFNNTSTGLTGNTAFYWTYGDGNSGFNQNEYHVYSSSGWYQVCLYIVDSLNNCQSTHCDSVFAGNAMNCQAYFTYQSNGLNTTFLNQSTGVNLNYYWTFGDGVTANGQNTSHQYSQSGQYLVCLVVSNWTCSDTMCTYVNVSSSNSCQASFSSADSAGVTYLYGNATGIQGTAVYTWDFGDGYSGTGQFQSHIYNGFGYVACLTVTDYDINQNILCTSTYCDSVLGGGGTSTCQSAFNWVAGFFAGQIDFADQSIASDSIVSWAWDFGDGMTSSQRNPSHTYTQTGSYYVCLTISTAGANGTITCTSTSCQWVQVQGGGGGCQAYFNSVDSLNTIYFYNGSTGTNANTVYYWNFGDGSTAYGQYQQHSYNSAGPFLVCLTISDSSSGCFDTYCDSIFINGGGGNQCQAAFMTYPDSSGNGFTFVDQSTGTNWLTSYLWTASDGTTGTGTTFYHTFAAQGWYAVCLTITVYDTLQNVTCTSNTCDSVYVGNNGNSCNAYWAYQSNSFATYFADQSSGTDPIMTWLWDFGDGSTSSQANPVHTYLQSGYYYVCLTIETGNNGVVSCTDTWCSYIYAGTNNTGCQANFSMYPDSSGLGFQFQNLSSGTTGSTVYLWNFGDGGSSTLENPYHQFSTGSYTVCLTIIDSAANCYSTYCDSLNLNGNASCNPYFVWNGDTANGVQFYQFNNNLPNIIYSWSFGDGDTSNVADPYHQYTTAGVYYACLNILQLDSNGNTICSGNFCDSVYTGGNSQGCAPQIVAVPDSNGWGNGNVNYSVYSPCGNINSVIWDFGDGTTGTGTNPSHQYSSSGWYYVCVDVEINGVIYTQCDSVFALRLVGIEEADGMSITGAYPNPASSVLHISYMLNQHEVVRVSLFDVTGREVRAALHQDQSAGLYHEDINLDGISQGVYVVKISAGNLSAAKRIVVNR